MIPRPLLLCRQQGEELTKRRMEYGIADETSTPPMKCGCFGSALPKHNNRPRCLRVVNSVIHAPHPLDLRGVSTKPPKPPILHNLSISSTSDLAASVLRKKQFDHALGDSGRITGRGIYLSLKKNQNAPRPSEHPPVRGTNCKVVLSRVKYLE